MDGSDKESPSTNTTRGILSQNRNEYVIGYAIVVMNFRVLTSHQCQLIQYLNLKFVSIPK